MENRYAGSSMTENDKLEPPEAVEALTEEDRLTEEYMADHRKKYQEWFDKDLKYGMIKNAKPRY